MPHAILFVSDVNIIYYQVSTIQTYFKTNCTIALDIKCFEHKMCI